MKIKFVDSYLFTHKYTNLNLGSKHGLEEKKIGPDGREYKLLGTAEKSYTLSRRIVFGIQAFAKTFFSLGLGLILQSVRDSWKLFWLGKKKAVFYMPSINNFTLNNQPFANSLILDLLAKRELFVRTIFTRKALLDIPEDPFQDRSWDFELDRLKNFQQNKFSGEKFIFDPETQFMKKYIRQNFYKGTKKISVSLLPSHGRMHVFSSDSIGILLDSNKCQFKNRYIFHGDSATIAKFWRYIPKKEDNIKQKLLEYANLNKRVRKHTALSSFNNLQSHIKNLEKQNAFIKHNEVLASINDQALLGLYFFYPEKKDQVLVDLKKLTSISRQNYVKLKLNKDLPIFSSNIENSFCEYHSREQRKDLIEILNDQHRFQELLKKMQSNSPTLNINGIHLRNKIVYLLENIAGIEHRAF